MIPPSPLAAPSQYAVAAPGLAPVRQESRSDAEELADRIPGGVVKVRHEYVASGVRHPRRWWSRWETL